jgi:hypothetical protein
MQTSIKIIDYYLKVVWRNKNAKTKLKEVTLRGLIM